MYQATPTALQGIAAVLHDRVFRYRTRKGKTTRRRWSGLASALLLGIACTAPPAAQPAPSIAAAALASPTVTPIVAPAEILAAGRLRMAIVSTQVGLIAKDATTGELTGVSVDIGRDLARRLGVAFVAVPVANSTALVAAVKAGTADMAFVNPLFPEFQPDFDFTPGLVEIDLTYLVPSGATVKSAADADRAGVRIVVRKGTAVDTVLSQSVKLAQVVRVDGTIDDAFAAMRAGSGDVLAGARPNLLPLIAKLPGSIVAADRFGVDPFGLAVPKGKADLLRAANQFARELKASDFVKQAITRAGAQGVQPTPP